MKGPNLNFNIQPDTADQQNVLTQNYDNKAGGGWLLASGEDGSDGEEGGNGTAEEVVEHRLHFSHSPAFPFPNVVFASLGYSVVEL